MSWRVSVRRAAQKDLRDAREWYEKQRNGLGDEFLLSVSEVFATLEESPEAFPIYYRDFRRAMLDRFPYKVFFLVHGNQVVVFRVIHGARDHPSLLP